MGTCKSCGKQTFGNYEYCMNCKPQGQKSSQGGGYRSRDDHRETSELPAECIFTDSFYESDGYIKGEVYTDAAEKMARLFQREYMTQTSLRHLFNAVNAIKMKLKSDRSTPQGYIRENFLKIIAHTEYQAKRGVVKEVFRKFMDTHKELAIKDRKEFLGFADYFMSIVARMKQK